MYICTHTHTHIYIYINIYIILYIYMVLYIYIVYRITTREYTVYKCRHFALGGGSEVAAGLGGAGVR